MHNSLCQSKVDTAVVEINLNTVSCRAAAECNDKCSYLIIAICPIHLLKIYLGINCESRLEKLINNRNRATIHCAYFSFNLSRHLSILARVPSIPASLISSSTQYFFLWSFLFFNFFFFFSFSTGRSGRNNKMNKFSS